MAVLRAKLRAPHTRRRLVSRPRLLRRLRALSRALPALVLISAPAGSGKTTLLSQWLGEFGPGHPPVAWLSLDEADADASRFLTHLIASLQIVQEDLGTAAQQLIDAGRDAPAATVSLIDDLDILSGPMVLVLDDYHRADDPAVHEVMRALIENQPPGLTIVIATREDPPLPLARLRARDELAELRAADLRFTGDEARTFVNEVMRANLPAAAVQAITERTEGWAVGLQLAALAAHGHSATGDLDQFVAEFTGSHRYVLDYLLEEVLDGVSTEVRKFLLDTSVLEEFTGPLCDAVTGAEDGTGRAMIAGLDRSGLFLVALDDRNTWFRYHHLFRAALQAQSGAASPKRALLLDARAALWLGENGMPEEALPHAVAADDPELAAELFELALAGLRRSRQDGVIRRWIREIPDDALRSRPLLAVCAAWERLAAGHPDEVGAWLDIASGASATPRPRVSPPPALAHARDAERRSVPAMIEVYRATISQSSGDTAGTRAHAELALALTAPDQHSARAAASGYIGLAAWAEGDLSTTTEAFSETIRSLRAAGQVADALGATVVLASMWESRGRPDEARRLLLAALAEADGMPGPLATRGDLHVGLAALLVEQGDLDAAEEHLRTAQELGDPASLPENRYRWHAVSASVSAARGEFDEASAALDAAEALFLPGFLPDVRPLSAQRARLRIAQGRLDNAEIWAQGLTLTDAFGDEFGLLTLVRLRIAQHRVAPARVSLDDVIDTITQVIARQETRRGAGPPIEARMLRALVLEALGDADAARDEISTAIRDAAKLGYARLFLDEGPAMHRILRRVASFAETGGAAEAARLLGLHHEPRGGRQAASPPRALIDEQLSPRELDVLRLLATDLTGPEIAAQLYVTLNTLRTHTKHIYTKLGVGTRRAAVRRAEQTHLI
jgi:LuxR family maltose regulon positive regulatory protein